MTTQLYHNALMSSFRQWLIEIRYKGYFCLVDRWGLNGLAFNIMHVV